MTTDQTKPAKPSSQPKRADNIVSTDDATVLSDAPEAPDTMVPPRDSSDTSKNNLRAVSDFAVLEKLGQGGMGVVYAAREKSLARNVAVKRLNQILSSDEKHRRGFRAEAVITGKLAHPNIIPIYSIVDERENLAIAMKLIEGRTLQEIINPQDDAQRAFAAQYDLKGKLQILSAVCNAVRFAHSKQIIHRDIKSGNIMVGEFGEILLLDWGLAVSISPSPEDAARDGLPHKSQIRGLEGTLFYMPPEMLKVDLENIGVQTDVYLLGAVLFEILTGKPPHAGRKLAQALDENQPSPRLPEDMDHELQSICTKALHPNVEGRYATVYDFQTAVTNFLRHGESRAACTAGRALLSRASEKAAGEMDWDERTAAYDLFAGAVFSFANAQDLWRHNDDAVSGEKKARLAYADCAARHGDFGLALLQLSPLEDDAVETLRREIAEKEKTAARAASAGRAAKKIAVSAALLTLASAILFFIVFMGASAMGREAALKTRIRLEKEGRIQMERIVSNASTQITAKKQLSETALLHFIHVTEPRQFLENADLPNFNRTLDTTFENQLEALTEKAAPLALQFSLVSAEPKLVYTFPEGVQYLADDIQGPQSWYGQVQKFGRMIHTAPKIDPASGRMLSATATPLFDKDGTFIGAAAMISDIKDILGGTTYPSNWGNDVKTEIVLAGWEEEKNAIVVFFSLDEPRRVAGENITSGLATIRPKNAEIPSKMRQDGDAGRIGVVELTRDGTDVFAGYTSVPGTRAQVMVSVPKHAMTAMADEIEATILNESRNRLLFLGKIVVGVFALMLLAALALVRHIR